MSKSKKDTVSKNSHFNLQPQKLPEKKSNF